MGGLFYLSDKERFDERFGKRFAGPAATRDDRPGAPIVVDAQQTVNSGYPEPAMRKSLKDRLVTAGALATLALVTLVGGSGLLAGTDLPASVELLLWCLAAAMAAAHRPFGGTGLGLGALALPAVIQRLGVPAAALVAGVARLLIAALGRVAERRARSDGWLLRGFVAATVVTSAALAGAALRSGAALESASFAWRAALPATVYVLSLTLIAVAGRRVLKRTWLRFWRATGKPQVRPLLIDGCGWILGELLADAAAVLGWGKVAPIVLVVALLGAEAARNAIARGASDDRVVDFERLHQAHERILGETSGMAAVADQILVECSNILPVYWYHFELESPHESEAGAPEGERRSWAAGPDGALQEGEPRPAPRPPMLPGVHRRAAWRIIEEPLAVDGEALGRVRLWCDPRQIEPGAEDLFATLVPQMASSVHRARLDREARLDPLTGVPVRRILDSSLQKAYRESCDQGRSVAVIMCDVDHFKQVNDTYGHAAGDEALIVVARTLDAVRRENDLCCRYGGEEFTLLLEDANGEAALRLADRLRQAVAEIDLVYDGRQIPLTMSAGVAAFPELQIKTAGELLLLADEALYEAKESGRNRCLLNLGRGAFRSTSGKNLGDPTPQELPRIFG